MTKLFALVPNTKFILHKKKFQLIKFTRERKPRLGKVFVAICQDLENGMTAKFLRDWEVEIIKSECPDHPNGHIFIPCDEWQATCTCGKTQ